MERKRTYGVWAVRSSTSIFGPAQSWCKENGKPLEFDSKADAENYAKEANEHTTANVRYYLDTFGFRGGEFGNWMNQNDRQTSLNMGFEALKDLASALKISDKDIAYQGTLAIAFGARGSGNAAAH